MAEKNRSHGYEAIVRIGLDIARYAAKLLPNWCDSIPIIMSATTRILIDLNCFPIRLSPHGARVFLWVMKL